MGTEPSFRRIVRFGVFEADLQAGELRKHGRGIRLQEKPFQFLALLLERPGEIVSREEVRDKLWNGNSSFDFNHGVANALSRLRAVLGDSANNPRFVATVPHRGYRFIASVEGPPTPVPLPPSRRWLWALAAILVAGIAGYALWPRSGTGGAPVLNVVPLTSYRGVEVYPALSPDGNDVAFSWDNEQAGNFDIYRRQIGPGETLVQLTNDPADELNPVWSPDGRSIAFLRFVGGEEWEVVVAPALPGGGRTLGQVSLGSLRLLTNASVRALDWSPDGRWLAVSHRLGDTGPRSIFLWAVDGEEKHRLTEPPSSSYGDIAPAFSPDGRALAYRRQNHAIGRGTIYAIQISDAPNHDQKPERLAEGIAVSTGPVWSRDGQEIFFNGAARDRNGLWRTQFSGDGGPIIVQAGQGFPSPSLSRDGTRMVFVRSLRSGLSIWSVELAGSGRPPTPRPFIPWLWGGAFPRYSPDGAKVVFHSNHSGANEIWLCNADGTELQPLTEFGYGHSGSPHWSADGRQVVFNRQVGEQWDVFTIPATGGTPNRRTSHPANDHSPSWSHDGRWVYFTSDRSGLSNVWKMPVNGGEAIPITKGGAERAIESVDGLRVYYLRDDGLWSASSAGGDETLLIESVRGPGFSVVEDGIYFMRGPERQDETTVMFYRFSTGRTETLLVLSGMSFTPWVDVSVSPDEKTLLYRRVERREADLMLVENFR